MNIDVKPVSEYRCQACKHTFSREQKITATPVKKCPKCKKLQAIRQITGGTFLLKGSGWASDGYKGTNK